MAHIRQNLAASYPLATFFALAYAITWLFSSLAAPGLLPFAVPPALAGLSGVLYHFGPALAAVIVAGATGGRGGVRGLLRPLRRWRVGARWYLLIALYPLAVRLLAGSLNALLGGAPLRFFASQGAGVPRGSPLLLFLPVFLSVFVLAGIAEEVGWRGFALPRLQARYSALTSSLILAALWAPWHYSPLNRSLVGPMLAWHVLAVVAFTVLLTWVYNSTQGSLLVAVLFHTTSNVADWVVPTMPYLNGGDVRPFALQVLLNLGVALAVVAVFGGRHLSRRERVTAGAAEREAIA